MRLQVEVLDHLAGRRVAAHVTVTEITNSTVHFEGTSRGETADKNDLLPFEVPRGATFLVRAENSGLIAGREFTRGTNKQPVVVIAMSDTTLFQFPAACCAVPEEKDSLKPRDESKLRQALADYFTAPLQRQATWKFAGGLEKLLREHETAVRHAAWEAYKTAPIHADMKKDFDANEVRFGDYLSPYMVRAVGERPAGGWPLFIAMHGGGATPKEVNEANGASCNIITGIIRKWAVIFILRCARPTTHGTVFTTITFIR